MIRTKHIYHTGMQRLLCNALFPSAILCALCGKSLFNDSRRLRLVAIALASVPFTHFAAVCQAEPTTEEVIAEMRPYQGPKDAVVDRSTLTGKVMCGYQGWFATPYDGSDQGWKHYAAQHDFRPGHCKIDLWPDVSELDHDEKFATPFQHSDGRTAYVFSSHNPKTVARHFRWMQEYGIDGVFVQRFAVATRSPLDLRHCNTVLTNCRDGANEFGRCYAVMYDLSGLRAGGIEQVIADWKLLVDRMRLGRDPADHAYLQHLGKPVVAVWGIGFNDDRKYTLEECDRLIEFLKNDPVYGGFTVMVGVPTYWRELDHDTLNDPALHAIIRKADIVSPWTVGRYRTPTEAARHARLVLRPDIAWCQENGKEYLPVVFPGFSWKNMVPSATANAIPRLKGEFLWRQFVEAKEAGATMIYEAMFDEIDEGTAIFKCTNDPPVSESKFVTYEGLPSDHYLWLSGKGGELLRGPSDAPRELPERKATSQVGEAP